MKKISRQSTYSTTTIEFIITPRTPCCHTNFTAITITSTHPTHTHSSTMPSYFTVPSSPTFAFFPTGTTSPNAFGSFHQNPRDTHAMYAAFTSSVTSQNRSNQLSQYGGKGHVKSSKF